MQINVNTPILIAAAATGTVLVFRSLRRLALPPGKALLFLALAWLSGLALGKLFYLANAWVDGQPYPIFYGGFWVFLLYGYSSVGGLLGAALAAWLFCRRSRLSPVGLLDACALPVLVMYGMVRVGCALYGCCYGVACAEPQSPFLQSLLIHREGRWLFPVQWLDSCLSFLLCFFIYRYNKARPSRAGRLRLFLLLFPLQRFLLEFLRGDAGRGMVWVFSTTQVFCLFVLILWLLFYLVRRKKGKFPDFAH